MFRQLFDIVAQKPVYLANVISECYLARNSEHYSEYGVFSEFVEHILRELIRFHHFPTQEFIKLSDLPRYLAFGAPFPTIQYNSLYIPIRAF